MYCRTEQTQPLTCSFNHTCMYNIESTYVRDAGDWNVSDRNHNGKLKLIDPKNAVRAFQMRLGGSSSIIPCSVWCNRCSNWCLPTLLDMSVELLLSWLSVADDGSGGDTHVIIVVSFFASAREKMTMRTAVMRLPSDDSVFRTRRNVDWIGYQAYKNINTK